jgi:predicted Zn-dependent protease
MRQVLKAFCVAVLAMMPSVLAGAAYAQTLIRDTELEAILLDMSRPLLTAARVNPQSVRLRLISDPALNAFVTADRSIYINTGLIERLERAEMLQSVIAHEIGHIVGGHAATRTIAAQSASDTQAVGLIAGVVLGIFAGPTAGLAVATGSQSAAERSYLGHSRADETAADQTGARLMDLAGIDPQATLDTMDVFLDQELLPAERQDPYARTHPYFSERRVVVAEITANALSRGIPPDQATQTAYDRMRAKIFGFTALPADVLAATEHPSDFDTFLARAIGFHRYPDTQQALETLQILRTSHPEDAYLIELEAQFLVETGHLEEGIERYRHALEFASDSPLIQSALGRALVARSDEAALAEAVPLLETVLSSEPGAPGAAESLARAYAARGDTGLAALTTAELRLRWGQPQDALRFARQAKENLSKGSPAWLRADDLTNELARYGQN